MNDYAARLEEQASIYASKAHPSLSDTRELLILSAATCCSTAHQYFEARLHDPHVFQHLIATIGDSDGFYSGDARIQAAFYLPRFDANLLRSHSHELLALYDAEDGEGAGGCLKGLLSRSLAAARVHGGRERILRDMYQTRSNNAFFVESLAVYDAT